MTSLWFMSPTKTDRRHFFLIEGTDIDISTIGESLVSAGLQRSDLDTSSYSTSEAEIVLRCPPTGMEPPYVVGVITPPAGMVRDARKKERLMILFGYLFYAGFLAFVLLLFAAFPIVLLEIPVILEFVALGIPLTSLLFLGCGVIVSGLGFHLDYRLARRNEALVTTVLERIIPQFQSDLHVQGERSDISTKFGDRGIKARLPPTVSEKIERVELSPIDAFFWR